MLWKLGWLVKSLKYQVAKDLHDTLHQNPHFLRNRWSPVEIFINFCSRHPILTSIFLLVFFTAFAVGLQAIHEYVKVYIAAYSGSFRSFLQLSPVLFGAQVTLLALIFPLVIALIGLLLRGRAANESLWTIYRQHSSFMLVGLSSVSFCIFYISANVIDPFLSYSGRIAFTSTSAIWFTVNILLSARFLWRTIQFLSANSRDKIVRNYVINTIAREDIKNRLMAIHSNLAVTNQLIQKKSSSQINLKEFTTKTYENELSIRCRQPKYIKNIWYRLIQLALYLINLRAKKKESKIDLVVSINSNGWRSSEHLIAKSDTDVFTSLVRFLFTQAVRLSSSDKQVKLTIEQVIQTILSDLENALKENNYFEFENAQNRLASIQNELQVSLNFLNDDDEQDNWLLLPESSWTARTPINAFIEITRKISSNVTRRIQTDSSYFESWCYFYPRLYTTDDKATPLRVSRAYIDGHFFIWSDLMTWLAGEDVKRPAIESMSDRAIKHFVGSWESWNYLLGKEFKTIQSQNFQCTLHHLKRTACMIVESLNNKNIEAAEWATDMLAYWYENFSNGQTKNYYPGGLQELITTDQANHNDNDWLAVTLRSTNVDNLESLIGSALVNVWTDIRVATAAYILTGTNESVDHAKTCVNSLLNCKRLKPTGTIDLVHSQVSKPSELLTSFLRINQFGKDSSSYKEFIGGHIESMRRIEEPAWVPGRIYSREGSGGELKKLVQVFGIGQSIRTFSLGNSVQNLLGTPDFPQSDKNSIIFSLKQLKTHDKRVASLTCSYFDIDQNTFEERAVIFDQSIDNVIGSLQADIDDRIIKAGIDDERLEEIGKLASTTSFIEEKPPLPVNLFKEPIYLSEFQGELSKVNIIDYRKSDVALGLEVNRSVNEAEFFDSIIRKRVSTVVFDQVIQNANWKTNHYANDINMLRKAVLDSKHITENQQTPILFIGPWGIFEMLDSARWKQANSLKEIPFDLSFQSGQPPEYICHLEDIAVFRMPNGNADFSLLLPEESFHKISFKQFEPGRFVRATFEPSKNDPLTGTLSLEFGVSAEIAGDFFFRYETTQKSS
ncbi:hypothetical protein [Idiomarina sp. HP20-50]|uniref:hypothetical protein n=1 Tax=Idiomarina sp. HP20-50 TaxID=3070813 RepID=UPI00294B9658|nr:hypothetical protein [Idiomarina sp. HP20-50]MDV6316687.1 hypothetical protein [Idiomarina sp. HP20-50]